MRKVFPILMVVLAFSGCGFLKSPPVPVESYPDAVGKYKRTTSPETANDVTPDVVTANYENSEDKEQVPINTFLVMKSSESRAASELENKTSCSSEYQKDVVKSKSPLELLKEDALKDKSGKTVGAIKVCRVVPVHDFKGKNFGTNDFYLTMTNNNLVLTINGANSAATNVRYAELSLDELIEFAKNLPYNSNIDFSPLNLEALNASIPQFVSAKDVNNFSAPKQSAEPYIKGKVVAVINQPTVKFVELSSLGLDNALQADNISDAQTIIKIGCRDAGTVTKTTVTQTTNRKTGKVTERRFQFPTTVSSCSDITIIDTTIPALIAESSISSSPNGAREFVEKLPRR